ncbi:hypothetical protein [Wolbachia endosymbiont of Trichogramma kaykai]|uniref:hypothetical protein n=1 Tax=Wolbachia endosymbiont of Trichogramma kaykai TaxID=444066 RepID=UPI0038920AB4
MHLGFNSEVLVDAQELENLQKSSPTKSQDDGEKTSEELERNLNPNEANNGVF